MNLPDTLVCVVDDEPAVRTSLVRMLNSAGLAAEAFESARAYLGRAPHAGPTCLVLDVRMPELTGLDLQDALIARGGQEQVVFITGEGDIPTSVQAMKAGAVDFLPKTFTPDELLVAVDRALVRARALRERSAGQAAVRERLATLSPREGQVLQGVIAGMLNKQIAAELGTSIQTVKLQRGHMMKKMGVTSVAELVSQVRKVAPGARPGETH